MVKVYFNGEYSWHEGGRFGFVQPSHRSIKLKSDDYLLFGNIDIYTLDVRNGSLDAKNATIVNNRLFIEIFNSKAENINNANRISLWDNSSLSNSSTNELLTTRGNNTIDGVVSAKEVKFYSTLSIAKNGVLKVPDKNALEFEKIFGEGKVFDEKTQTYYNTDGVALNNAKDLLAADIIKYDFAIAKATEKAKDKKDAYVNVDTQNSDVDLLNIEAVNNDNLL